MKNVRRNVRSFVISGMRPAQSGSQC